MEAWGCLSVSVSPKPQEPIVALAATFSPHGSVSHASSGDGSGTKSTLG